jgi:Protein of unknown function (DUF2934)
MTSTGQTDDREARIREVAYFLWLEEGCPEGQAERRWAAAEAIVATQEEPPAAPSIPPRRNP